MEDKGKIPEALDVAGLTDDPLIARTLREDPLIKFLDQWWRQVLVVALVVTVVLYAKTQFENARLAEMKRAADLFAGVRAQYTEVVALQNERDETRSELAKIAGTDEKKKAELETKLQKIETDLNERIKPLEQALLALGDAREPYRNFVPLYSALVAQLKGGANAAKQAIGASSWQELSDLNSSERLVAELKALYLARLLLDDSATNAQGQKMLTELASQGVVAHVSAAYTLARLATTAEEKKNARVIIEGILLRHPEQRELLQSELERLQ